MSKKYYQEFAATGVIASTVFDGTGLTSPEGEKRLLTALLISVSTVQGNLLEAWLEREKLLSIYDNVLHTDLSAGATGYASTNRIIRIEMNHEIPIGNVLKVAIKSGATANNIHGAYEYEIVA
jgi:hypothetical protein